MRLGHGHGASQKPVGLEKTEVLGHLIFPLKTFPSLSKSPIFQVVKPKGPGRVLSRERVGPSDCFMGDHPKTKTARQGVIIIKFVTIPQPHGDQ